MYTAPCKIIVVRSKSPLNEIINYVYQKVFVFFFIIVLIKFIIRERISEI